jgi:hypothetical protein
MCVIAAICLLLRARLFAGLLQRLWLLGAGVAVSLSLAYRLTTWFGRPAMLGSVIVLVIAAGCAAVWAVRPERRVAAPWARYADLLEFALTVALVPLALELLRVYSGVRSLAG